MSLNRREVLAAGGSALAVAAMPAEGIEATIAREFEACGLDREDAIVSARESMQPGGGLLKQRRLALGLTPGQAGARCDLNALGWTVFENGEREPLAREGWAICKAFNITPEQLINEFAGCQD